MTHYKDVSWNDLGQLFDGPHATPTRTNSGPYFLNISSLSNGRLDLNQSDHVSDEEFVKWTRRVTPEEGDLLFSYETRLGEAALMPPDINACLGRRMALLRPNRDVVDPRFLLYFYLSPQFQRLIEQHTIHGATVNRISLSTMGSWEVSIPNLQTQRAIAEVLGALDDKIAANIRLATGAVEYGRTLYRHALSRGPVDKHKLNDVAGNFAGKYLAKEDYVSNGPYFVYGSNSIMGMHNEPLYQGGFSVLAKIGSYCGNLRWSQRPAWVNNNASAIVPSSGTNPWILRYALEQIDMSAHKAGTGQPYILMGSLFADEVHIPEPAVAEAISPLLEHLSEVEARANEENVTLASLRDTLLPNLMSGKLWVKDAEKTLGAAM